MQFSVQYLARRVITDRRSLRALGFRASKRSSTKDADDEATDDAVTEGEATDEAVTDDEATDEAVTDDEATDDPVTEGEVVEDRAPDTEPVPSVNGDERSAA